MPLKLWAKTQPDGPRLPSAFHEDKSFFLDVVLQNWLMDEGFQMVLNSWQVMEE